MKQISLIVKEEPVEGFDGTEEVVVEKSEVEIFDISPSGDIFIEIEGDDLSLTDAENFIDLKEPYTLDGLRVSQGEEIIYLYDQMQVMYFIKLVEEIKSRGQHATKD